MANDVKWIKMMVGMFDGMSFKKIKRAKIGGESFRDKLTAVWFELMDFAGKCNHEGAFISPAEIPFTDLADIATMIDRDEEEIKLCMAFFIKEGMVTVIDDVYSLSNWAEYQNKEGLDKIREQTRKRVAKHRERQQALLDSGVTECNVTGSVTVTQCNALEEDKDKESDIRIREEKENGFSDSAESASPSHTDSQISYQQIADLYNSICKSFPSVRSLSDARRKAIKARLKSYTMEDFRTVFENAEASSFLKGSNDRNWSANFDWLIKDSNMAKVLEGNYADKARRYGRKEPVPGWCQSSTLGDAELEAIRNVLQDEPDTVGNNPDLAERAEKLKQRIQEM